MKVKVKNLKLKELLKYVNESPVNFYTKDNTLYIYSDDALIKESNIEIVEEGGFRIYGAFLSVLESFLNKLNDKEPFFIEVQNDEVQIKQNDLKFFFRSNPDFEIARPHDNQAELHSIPTDILIENLKNISNLTSISSHNKYPFVYLVPKENTTDIVFTDCVVIYKNEVNQKLPPFCIPQEKIKFFLFYLPNQKELQFQSYTENNIYYFKVLFKVSESLTFEIRYKANAEKFPPFHYDLLYSKTEEKISYTCNIEKQKLENLIKNLRKANEDKNKNLIVILRATKEALRFTLKDSNYTEVLSVEAIKFIEPVEVAFNAKILLKCLKSLNSSKLITFELTTPKDVICLNRKTQTSCLFMPVMR